LATITTIIKVASIGKLVPEDFSTHTQTKSCQKGSKPARTCLSKSKRSWQVLSGFGSFWPDLAGFLPKPLFGRIGKDGPESQEITKIGLAYTGAQKSKLGRAHKLFE
jgi:hypothetical protein